MHCPIFENVVYGPPEALQLSGVGMGCLLKYVPTGTFEVALVGLLSLTPDTG